jgi:hypothetical protein
MRAPLTDASGSSSSPWPTPNASKASNDTTLTRSGDGRETPNKLGWAVAWATPQAHDAKGSPGRAAQEAGGFQASLAAQVKQWPTPTSRDWKDGACQGADVESNALLGRVALEGTEAGALNPDWVESLMGFPAGWTRTDGPPAASKRSTSGKRRASRKVSPNDGSG